MIATETTCAPKISASSQEHLTFAEAVWVIRQTKTTHHREGENAAP